MRIPVVNESDEQIGVREREELLPEDIYRVSALWLLNQEGQVLLAQRALTKRHHPGLWGCSVAGTVEAEETYESNILKEAEEELGLSLTSADLRIGPKLRIEGQYRHFCQFYFAHITKKIPELKIEAHEVIAVRWMDMPGFIEDVRNFPEKYSINLEECLLLL